ncbi:hypothetical protein BV22DRAFT_1195934 [Leucogyrophana mollusca]|uniref:Uncharacterized protein n=1 Tax=Leucogyrophana mollusca TaxID=85980 RepID=A0ACB8BGH7_9AGAM|nr:hypothetical protein BV22DRAFT_1195934 [Leucogyrophana mollusca]
MSRMKKNRRPALRSLSPNAFSPSALLTLAMLSCIGIVLFSNPWVVDFLRAASASHLSPGHLAFALCVLGFETSTLFVCLGLSMALFDTVAVTFHTCASIGSIDCYRFTLLRAARLDAAATSLLLGQVLTVVDPSSSSDLQDIKVLSDSEDDGSSTSSSGRARNMARRVPCSVIQGLVPLPSCSVSGALTYCATLVHPSPAHSPPPSYSSTKPPNILTDDSSSSEFRNTLRNLCLPALSTAIPHAQTLRTGFDDAWRAGAKSICIPAAPAYYFPLWVERLVGDLEIASQKLAKWSRATNWLDSVSRVSDNSEAADLVEVCRDRLEEIPWDAMVPDMGANVHLTAPNLALFLSNEWLNDDMIDAGSAFIMHLLGTQSRIRITDTHFMHWLRDERSRRVNYTLRTHSPLDNAIRNGGVDILEVVLNPGGVHWAGIKVDIVQRTFAYRDGLNPSRTPSREDMELLDWYLTDVVGDHNHSNSPRTADPIQTPRQHDSHSCGIVYLSSLASEYLGQDYHPWSQEASTMHRMEWFLRLSETLESVVEPKDGKFDTACAVRQELPPPSRPLSTGGSTGHEMKPDFARTDNNLRPKALMIPSPPPPTHSASPLPRKHPMSDSDSDTESDNGPNRGRRRFSGVREGSSWAYQKALKESAASRDFVANERSLSAFRRKVLQQDPHAEFNTRDLRAVRCSACAEWIVMRVLYDIRRWNDHRASRKCQKRRSSGLVTKSLCAFFPLTAGLSSASPSNLHPSSDDENLHPSSDDEMNCDTVDCAGLPRTKYPRVGSYLDRSAAEGGGAPCRRRIARQLFPGFSDEELAWPMLSARHRQMVLVRERALQKWHNRRNIGAVFSSSCTGVGLVTNGEPSACAACLSLLKLHSFQNILNRKMPIDENMKFVPKAFRCPDLSSIYLKYEGVRKLVEEDDDDTPWLRFAKGVADGLYKSQEVALGMVEAIVKKSERVVKGQSLKNMKYTTAFDSFCSLLASTSTRAYRTFQHQFGGRSLRSMQALRAKQPRFQPGFSQRNIIEAAASLRRLKYSGPLALSWDDTDLEKALAVWQESKDVWTILGSTEGPVRVQSLDEVDKVFEGLKLAKAEKLRLYVLTIPLPKIPPIVLAAVARSSKDSAEVLAKMHFDLSKMMHAEGLHPISLAADGTETERGAQRIITASADKEHVYVIPNDVRSCVVQLNIPLFDGYPSVCVQDSKHALKTARNQLFTGARLLALGNFPIYFQMLLDIANHALGPLFRRDVDRVDKQDDRAAARLFAAETLDCTIKHFADRPALSVYLFILGELVDAWQNRSIPHAVTHQKCLVARTLNIDEYTMPNAAQDDPSLNNSQFG